MECNFCKCIAINESNTCITSDDIILNKQGGTDQITCDCN